MEDYWTECQYYDIVCFVFGNCNHCCFRCGNPFTMLGVSLFISCKNIIQCVCVGKKEKKSTPGNIHLKKMTSEKELNTTSKIEKYENTKIKVTVNKVNNRLDKDENRITNLKWLRKNCQE